MIVRPIVIKSTILGVKRRFPVMEHIVPVPKADSVIMVEINPGLDTHNDNGAKSLQLFLSYERIPNYRKFTLTTTVADLPVNETLGHSYWFLDNNIVLNQTGRWFLTVMQLNEPLTQEEITDGFFDKKKVANFTTDYKLRTYTAGCYYLDEKYEIWTGK